ncbi:uncharacterized protein EV422DRAFT_66361 [Fimicolochytrium jonesii]|uniref:uncharacterized protein n=1 Tax=Fimicolochytrium jonesii TaxID=1396493 RepID=UPI0022FDDA3C|nr:uncharacterized protein EV422DRAFT_66361 [Fimicolochytrium jonesii]KAI8820857.1 hypothetical protein EV422DRAFT_66361 [Fimicolochytrium jonesii]
MPEKMLDRTVMPGPHLLNESLYKAILDYHGGMEECAKSLSLAPAPLWTQVRQTRRHQAVLAMPAMAQARAAEADPSCEEESERPTVEKIGGRLWTKDYVKLKLLEFVGSLGLDRQNVMPTKGELRKGPGENETLINYISRVFKTKEPGTINAFHRAAIYCSLNYKRLTMPDDYWKSFENIKAALEDVMAEHGLDRVTPTLSEMRSKGKQTVYSAIKKHRGGVRLLRHSWATPLDREQLEPRRAARTAQQMQTLKGG